MSMSRPGSIISPVTLAAVMLTQVLLVLAGFTLIDRKTASRDASVARLELERMAELLCNGLTDAEEAARRVPERLWRRGDAAPLRPGDVRVRWMREDGHVLADSHDSPSVPGGTTPEVRAAMEFGSGFSLRRSGVVPSQQIAVVARRLESPFDMHGQSVALVSLSRPVDGGLLLSSASGRERWIVLAAVLFGSPLVAMLAGRRLRRTVAPIAGGARRFAAGEFTRRIERPLLRDMVELADTLNVAAAGLDRQISLLQRQRNEQRIILQSMSNAVVALDLDHRILSMNAAAERMLQLPSETARGRLLQESVRQPALNRFVSKTINEGAQPRTEIDLEGDPRLTVEVTSESLRGPNDRPVGVLILLNDVTKLRRLESLRSDFAANVSHELRTPITNIKGYVETLLEVGTEDREQTRRFLEIVKGNSDRLASIIEDLLALARLEQPDTRQSLTLNDVTVASVCAEVVGSLASVARAKDILLDAQVDRRLRFRVNRQLIEQALANLVSNAIKYSPGGSTITITARERAGERIALEVRDEGPGIAAEHLPRLFERFYRIDKARSREMGGTGLGLAIVKHIALVHGGNVEVETEIGRGSLFRLDLPAGNAFESADDDRSQGVDQ